MNDELFAELLTSVREGGAILRGEQTPSRRFEGSGPDVKQGLAEYLLPSRPKEVTSGSHSKETP